MFDQNTGQVILGGGGGDVDLTGIATEAWVEENYLSKAFFTRLFKAYGPAETEGDPDVEVEPNDLDSEITSIEAMFGFWTEQYISALGQGSGGGGGGGGSDTLADLIDVELTNPVAGQVLKYNGTKWINSTASAGTVTSVAMSVPTGFAVTGSPITVSGVLGLSFADGYSLPTTAKQTNWDAAYSWTSVSRTTLADYGITDAKFGTPGTDSIPITLGSATQSVLTQHQSLANYYTKSETDGKFLTISFFRSLFRAYTSSNAEVQPNDGSTSTIASIKAMFGFWTEQYISALGQGSGGGGGVTLNQPLQGINQAGLSAPTTAGQILVYNGTKWAYAGNISITNLTAYAGTFNSTVTAVGSFTSQGGNFIANSGGFKVTGKDDTYVLLAGGGTKLLSEIGGGYTLPAATTSALGGVKVNATFGQAVSVQASGNDGTHNYGLQIDSNGKAFVYVPWTDHTEYLPLSGGTLTGNLSIRPIGGGYADGIRLHARSQDDGWCAVMLCGAENTGDIGTSANSWYIGARNGGFYITRNGTSDGTAGLSCVSNTWYINGNAIAVTSQIPTNNNQLTNGAGYITSASLNGYLPLSGGTITDSLTIDNNLKTNYLNVGKNTLSTYSASRAEIDLVTYGDDAADLWLGANNRRTWYLSPRGSSASYSLLLNPYNNTTGAYFSIGADVYANGFIGNLSGNATSASSLSVTHYYANVPISTTSSVSTEPSFRTVYIGDQKNTNAFVNIITLAHDSFSSQLSVADSDFDETVGSWGLSFDRWWNGNNSQNSAGIYAYGTGSWGAGLVFRVKNGGSRGSGHNTTALVLKASGVVSAPNGFNGNLSGNATTASGLSVTHYCGTVAISTDSSRTTEPVVKALHVFPSGGSYNDGIRIHSRDTNNGWCSVVFAASDNTGNTGITSNSWTIGVNGGNLFMGKGGTGYGNEHHLRSVYGAWECSGTWSQLSDMSVGGNFTVSGSVRIGDAVLVWDSTNGALKVQKSDGTAASFYATGAVSALGASSSGTTYLDQATADARYLKLSGGTLTSALTVNGNFTSSSTVKGTSGLMTAYMTVGTSSVNSSYTLYVNGNAGINHIVIGNEQQVNTVNCAVIQTLSSRGIYIKSGSAPNYVDGTWNNASDIRLKDIVSNVGASVEQVADAPVFNYKWKAGGTQVMLGTSAQYWRNVFNFGVNEGPDSYLYMDYASIALASAVMVARKVQSHEERIAALEAENARLQKELNEIKAA
jgi:hypothetical protein